jgi:rhodanese-related sulfurtransferase
MRGQMEMEEEPPEAPKKRGIRLFRRTSYVLLLVFIAIVIFVVLQIKQPAIDKPDLRIVDLDVWEEELSLETMPIIIDIREAYRFEESRIPGAQWGSRVSCSTYGVDTCDTTVCDDQRNWYFYSKKGEEYHEVISAINVTYTRQCWATVYLLEGGFDAWEKAGNEVDSEKINLEE